MTKNHYRVSGFGLGLLWAGRTSAYRGYIRLRLGHHIWTVMW